MAEVSAEMRAVASALDDQTGVTTGKDVLDALIGAVHSGTFQVNQASMDLTLVRLARAAVDHGRINLSVAGDAHDGREPVIVATAVGLLGKLRKALSQHRLRALALAEMFSWAGAYLALCVVDATTEAVADGSLPSEQCRQCAAGGVARITSCVLACGPDWRLFYRKQLCATVSDLYGLEISNRELVRDLATVVTLDCSDSTVAVSVDNNNNTCSYNSARFEDLRPPDEFDAEVNTVLRLHLLRSFTRITGLEFSAKARACVLQHSSSPAVSRARGRTMHMSVLPTDNTSSENRTVIRATSAISMMEPGEEFMDTISTQDITQESLDAYLRTHLIVPLRSTVLRGRDVAPNLKLAGFCQKERRRVYLELDASHWEDTGGRLVWFANIDDAQQKSRRTELELDDLSLRGCYTLARRDVQLLLIPAIGQPHSFLFPSAADRNAFLESVRYVAYGHFRLQNQPASAETMAGATGVDGATAAGTPDDEWVLIDEDDSRTSTNATSRPGPRLEWEWQKERLRRFSREFVAKINRPKR